MSSPPSSESLTVVIRAVGDFLVLPEDEDTVRYVPLRNVEEFTIDLIQPQAHAYEISVWYSGTRFVLPTEYTDRRDAQAALEEFLATKK